MRILLPKTGLDIGCGRLQMLTESVKFKIASAVKVSLKRREENPGYTGNEEFNYFLSVLFAESELHIMDYNRVVKDLNGLSPEAFLEKVREKFTVI